MLRRRRCTRVGADKNHLRIVKTDASFGFLRFTTILLSEYAYLHKHVRLLCVLSGFHIFMKTVNNLPKYLVSRFSNTFIWSVLCFSLPHSRTAQGVCIVSVCGSFISQMNCRALNTQQFEMEAYYIITKHSNWILCQTELNFYFAFAEMLWLQIVVSEMQKKKKNTTTTFMAMMTNA